MVNTVKRKAMINKFVKIFLFLAIILFILTIFNPFRKFLVYKSTGVFEDNPLGSFVHDYNNVNQFEISNLQPNEIDVQEYTYDKVKYRKYENIIKWTLKADEFFKGYTDVLGICRYHFYVYPSDKVKSAIEIDHQGGACDFWENIKQDDTVEVIGEVVTSKPNWTEAGKSKKYATDHVIEVRPMIIKHNNKMYIDISLPSSLKNKLLEEI